MHSLRDLYRKILVIKTLLISNSAYMEPFRVRDYQPEDFEKLIRLWEPLGLGGRHRGDDQEVIRRTLSVGGRLLLLEDTSDGAIIGSSWMTVDGRRTYLHHFGIHADYQNRKLGRLLLDESLRVARNIGLQLKLEVHQTNTRAIDLYRKNGFEFLGDYDVYIIRSI